MDGWSNPKQESLWNFVIHTPDHKDYLYEIKNLSNNSHTGEFLKSQILSIIEEIGYEKFSAIVTDGGSNVQKARDLISETFPNILNIRCIAHCLHLISKDIISHSFAKNIINNCNILVRFFGASHRVKDKLESMIEERNIIGGGLKSYVDTRWTTIYETLESVYRLRTCMIDVSYFIIFVFVI